MNRRQFVTSMFGAVVAAPLLEKLQIPRFDPFNSEEDLSGPLFAETFEVTLSEFRRLFDASYRAYLGEDYLYHQVSNRSNKMGSVVGGYALEHQLNVGFGDRDLRDETGRYLPAAAGALAVAAAQHEVGFFVNLETPLGILYSAYSGPVRMCVSRDPVWFHHHAGSEFLVRFDVLGGKTEEAVLAYKQVRQRNLKVTIKERLLVTRGLQMRLPS